MTRVTAEVTLQIESTPQEAFDYFCDLRNEPEYNQQVSDIRQTTAGPVGLGTRFEGRHVGLGACTWELTEYEAPRHVVVQGVAGASRYRWVGDFVPEEGKTRMTGRMELEARGALGALGPLVRPLLRLSARRAFLRFGRAVEGHPRAPGRSPAAGR